MKLMCMVVAENGNMSQVILFKFEKVEDVLASPSPEEDAVSDCHHEEVRLHRQSYPANPPPDGQSSEGIQD